MKFAYRAVAVLCVGVMTSGMPAWSQPVDPAVPAEPAAAPGEFSPRVGQAGKDVVWVPTPQTVVDRMLDMAQLHPGDRLVDLGSGDGRTVISAAKRGVAARGIEYDPNMVALSRRAAQAEGVADKVSFEQADIFQSDFSEATVVTLFLLPALNLKLRPALLAMKPGTRILSNSFAMDEWLPDETAKIDDRCTNWCTAHKWIVPAKVAGRWRIGDKELVLTQTYQVLHGSLNGGGTQDTVSEGRLSGTHIEFVVNGERYAGEVNGDTMSGRIDGKTTWRARRRV